MKFRSLLLICLLFPLPLVAAEGPDTPEARIRAALDMGGEEKISPSPVPGLYEVVMGPHLFYVTEDGRYMVQGDVIDIAARENLSAPARAAAQGAAIDSIGEENMVVFSPEKPAHTITVFTDIDCGYCRKLHREMDQINAKGIKVRYLLYPRTGVDSPSYEKAVSVWCAKDRNQALTQAKAGATPEKATCDNPVKEHMAMGQMVGVRGTPTIVLEDGRILPGYVPADRLATLLNDAAP